MAQLCEFIHREPRGDHVALLEVPADKRCRIVSIKTKDGHKDRITLEVTPYKEGESYSENGALEVSAIFLALQRFPYMEPVERLLGALAPS